MKLLNSQKGFTIIEVIVSIGIITFVSVAMSTLANRSLQAGVNSANRTKAYGLAQQMVEIVRNTRDNNWLKSLAWNAGLETDNNDTSLGNLYNKLIGANPTLVANAIDGKKDAVKLVDNSGFVVSLRFYPIKTSSDTDINVDNVIEKVEVTVTWQSGAAGTVKSETYISNWKGGK